MTGDAGRVLVADDDESTRRSLERGLRLGGFRVTLAGDGRAALAALGADEGRDEGLDTDTDDDADGDRHGHAYGHDAGGPDRPDIVVLDICMPGLSGIDVCRTLRARGDDVPVLMLSALDEVEDRVAGLQAGGDDYLVKPFALQELELRLRALLRRRPPAPTDRVRVGGLALDPAARAASVAGRPLELTRREFALLEVLARNAGLVLTREQLTDRVWGYDFPVRTDVVDTFVSYLRRKLEADGHPRVLHTVRGVGFVLRPDRPDRPGGGGA
ncbi:response regulator transcription factor [Streptomyces sp. Z26]|uniref:response regulator transcription factor n=1 Tax=Streptomyces sp. Z26 TaxID=2500177 RepID=UPI000EF153AA|nr:response regulator transcription factor [Streptomyces sp. Z26]RLL70088.1 DNA-binding response regulator [Streptomyces sp. Z26]